MCVLPSTHPYVAIQGTPGARRQRTTRSCTFHKQITRQRSVAGGTHGIALALLPPLPAPRLPPRSNEMVRNAENVHHSTNIPRKALRQPVAKGMVTKGIAVCAVIYNVQFGVHE